MTLLSSPVEKQGNFLKISFHCLYTKFCLRLKHAKLPEGLMLFPLICIKKQNDYDCDTKENDCLKNQFIYPDKFANGLIIFLIGGRSLLSLICDESR